MWRQSRGRGIVLEVAKLACEPGPAIIRTLSGHMTLDPR